MQKILASDGEALDWFGSSVSISGDYAIVGTYAESAYVFYNNAGTWEQKTCKKQ